jgi:MFS family permease
LFGLASALSALTPSATLAIAVRALQGVGAALIFPVSVPLTLVVLAIGARSIAESFDETVPRRIDVTGLALITVGIGLFTLTFDRAPSWGWLSAPMVIAFAGSLVALALFVAVEKRVRWPLVDLSLVQNPRFTVLVIAGTIANIAYGVTIFLSTMYLQEVRGLDPLTAGLVFLGPSAGAALGGVLAGRRSRGGDPDRVDHPYRCRSRGVRNGAGDASAHRDVAGRCGRRHRRGARGAAAARRCGGAVDRAGIQLGHRDLICSR